jgi:hypothetical protein
VTFPDQPNFGVNRTRSRDREMGNGEETVDGDAVKPGRLLKDGQGAAMTFAMSFWTLGD